LARPGVARVQLRCCWSLYPLATLPVEVTLPLPLTRVDTARCEGLTRHPGSVKVAHAVLELIGIVTLATLPADWG
jgi:hypothetical protein